MFDFRAAGQHSRGRFGQRHHQLLSAVDRRAGFVAPGVAAYGHSGCGPRSHRVTQVEEDSRAVQLSGRHSFSPRAHRVYRLHRQWRTGDDPRHLHIRHFRNGESFRERKHLGHGEVQLVPGAVETPLGCITVIHVIINVARRAHNHNWELDPIVRSLLDTDFYKLLMLQFIWKHFPRTRATFSLQNRTTSVRLGEVIEFPELREQLEAVRKLRFHKSEMIWLAGNTFYGRRGMFEPAFLEWLDTTFRLSDFELSVEDGQINLSFEGLWTETTLWEIYSLSIIDELKTRAALKRLSEFELDIMYARAKTRLWEKMERLRGVPGLSLSDFGTRRRHSFLWHEYVVKAMSDVLEANFAGSSNTYLAYKHDLEAIGTNAHELPMALTALAETDEEMRTAQYRLLELWQQTYQGELLILLPDTFGTTQFLEGAPEWVADWTGQRIDSKDPFVAGDEYIAWLEL